MVFGLSASTVDVVEKLLLSCRNQASLLSSRALSFTLRTQLAIDWWSLRTYTQIPGQRLCRWFSRKGLAQIESNSNKRGIPIENSFHAELSNRQALANQAAEQNDELCTRPKDQRFGQ